MKKLLVLFLAVSMATFTSCKKDDDDKIVTEKPVTEKPVNNLIGKWKLVVNEKIQDITNSGLSEEAQKCSSKSYMEIEITETAIIKNEYNYDEETKTCKERKFSGKYTIDGDNIVGGDLPTKFKVSGDTLTITYDEGNEIKDVYKRM